jgi:general stress protein YciG
MSGTKVGYAKVRIKMIQRFGSESAYLQWKRDSGSKGGKASTGYAFAHGKVDPSVAGARGGAVSRRRKAVVNV